MLKLARLLSLLLMMFGVSLVAAQEADEAWPLEEQCVGDPTRAPEGWTFPGDIIMTGPFGVHAVNASLDTPFVVAFINEEGTIPEGSALSPDGEWYAVRIGTKGEGDGFTRVIAIRVKRLDGSGEVYQVPWYNIFADGGARLGQPSLLWWDRDHLLYETSDTDQFTLVNPFTGELSDWDYPLFPLDVNERFFQSPDWSRVVVSIGDAFTPERALYDAASSQRITDLDIEGVVAWQGDSTQFAAQAVEEVDGEPVYSVTLFDRDGNPLDTMLNLQPNEVVRTMRWSPDSRYLSVITTLMIAPNTRTLYVVDAREEQVVNTCLETADGVAWSPDSQQLAIIDFFDFRAQRPVMVLDVASGGLHTVAFHNGDIIGWRE